MTTSQISISALLTAVALHLLIVARFVLEGGADTAGGLLGGGAVMDALVQSFLLVAPPFALYGGIRAAVKSRDDILAYLAISGGGLLTLLTGGSLLAQYS